MTSSALKIAVLFFGHLRTFEQCAESVRRNLLDLYDCDVFMHTWQYTNCETETWHNFNYQRSVVDGNVIEKIKKTYPVLDLIVEPELSADEDEYIPLLSSGGRVSKTGVRSMLHSIASVVSLCKKRNKTYDYIVLIRPDVLLKTPLDIAALSSELKAVPYPDIRFCAFNPVAGMKGINLVLDRASDVVSIAVPEVMFKLPRIFKELSFEKYTGGILNVESFFSKVLFDAGVVSQPLNYLYDADWSIVRPVQKKNSFFKKIVSFRIRKNLLRLRLLGGLNVSLFSIKADVFKVFHIEFTIGASSC